MKSFREYISEALIDVDKEDVNKIYAPYAKPFKQMQAVWKKYSKNDILYDLNKRREIMAQFREIFNSYPPQQPLKVFQSSELKSDLAKKAHEVNPVSIYVFLQGNGNFYNPQKKLIYLSVDSNIVRAMCAILDTLPTSQLDMLIGETTDLRMKTTIRHELTHWIDDSMHNFYIKNTFDKAQEIKSAGGDFQTYVNKVLYKNENDPYLAPVEVTAMVNQIAELKRRMTQKKYDSLTWVDLLQLIPGLHFSDRKLGAEFRKKMFARLARENLVGASFTKRLT